MQSKDLNQKKLEFWWRYFEGPKRTLNYILKRLLGKPREITNKEIEKDRKKYSGELVTTGYQVFMLLDVVEDEDLFWIALEWKGRGVGQIVLHPYIIHFSRLKTMRNPFDYWMIRNSWDLNGMTLEKGLEMAREQGYDV